MDLYGGKYFTDKSWSAPSAYFAKAPSFLPSYIDQIYDGPIPSAAALFSPAHAPPNTPPPPRNAWMITTLKDGTWLEKVVKDGDYGRIDGTKGFQAGFPPTVFVQGTGDTVMDHRLSIRAAEELKGHGVEVELLLPEGLDHMFDMALKGDEPVFKEYLVKGFEFLRKHV
jgi:acetyl esterase/lipase